MVLQDQKLRQNRVSLHVAMDDPSARESRAENRYICPIQLIRQMRGHVSCGHELHDLAHKMQNLILEPVDVRRVGRARAGEEHAPEGIPTLCFRLPELLAAVEFDQLICVDTFAALVMSCPDRSAAVQARCPPYILILLCMASMPGLGHAGNGRGSREWMCRWGSVLGTNRTGCP